jgi:uncharacterized protein YcaQ
MLHFAEISILGHGFGAGWSEASWSLDHLGSVSRNNIRKLYEMNCHIATDRATESRFSNYPIQSWMLFKSHKSLGYFSPESIVLYDSQ